MNRLPGLALLCVAALSCGVTGQAQAQTAAPIDRATRLALFFDPFPKADPKAPPPPPPPPPPEGQRIDERRPEQPFSVDAFGRPVQVTGSWEYTDEKRGNFDLNRAAARDRRVREHEVKLEARTRLAPDTELFLQAVGLHETRRTQGSATTRSKALERGQTWVKFERLRGSRWALQAGRVALIERRAWWWDDDLDAVRMLGSGDGWRLDTGLARELLRVSSADRGIEPARRGVTRWFGQATWRTAPRHAFDLFWLAAHDASPRPADGSSVIDEDATDPSDLNARWFGLRASGEWRHGSGTRLGYWADTAVLRGRESLTDYNEAANGSFVAGSTATRRVRGHAFDVGTVLVLPLALRPSISAGYARGSGGERSATLDANFRQTGLQENKARLAGVKRLRIYGELLQPELSNLEVRSLSAGVRLLDNSSLELIGYRYRQPVPSTSIPGARLSADPLGVSGDIGREIDVLLALREWKHFELTLRWSRFTPGAAFAEDQRDPAQAIELGASLNF